MKRISISNPKIIDYPFTKFKSSMMDIYLISKCEFFLGAAGIWDIANLFQKPLLMPNQLAMVYVPPPKKTDLIIYKSVFSKSNRPKLVP